MLKNQEQKKINNFTEEKIPWYRRRWFWGVVLAVVFALLLWMSLNSVLTFHVNNSFELLYRLILTLPFGIFIVGGLRAMDYFRGMLSYYFSLFYHIIYYLGIFLLIYKTFYKPRVKIKYPLILIAIVVISLFGVFASAFGY